MPRRGTREWNRQQNLRRDQVITAEPVIIQNVETVIVEAQEYDSAPLRQKIDELTTEVSNKKRQIEQLKENTKQQKKLINMLKKKIHQQPTDEKLNSIFGILMESKIMVTTDKDIQFNMIRCNYEGVKHKGNKDDCEYLTKGFSTNDFDRIQNYIKQLEMIIVNNKLAFDCLCEINGETDEKKLKDSIQKMGIKSSEGNPKFYDGEDCIRIHD